MIPTETPLKHVHNRNRNRYCLDVPKQCNDQAFDSIQQPGAHGTKEVSSRSGYDDELLDLNSGLVARCPVAVAIAMEQRKGERSKGQR